MTRPIPLHGGMPSLFDRIGEERLRRLLWTFYAKVMQDPILAPVFLAKVGPFPEGGWPVHIARLEGFWRAVTHGPSDYKGRPGAAHIGLGIGSEHFERWLELWEQTLNEQLPTTEAQALLQAAQRMRVHLERMATHHSPAQSGI